MGISGNDIVRSKEKIIYREVNPGDLKEIVRIEKESFPDPWNASQLLFEVVHEYTRGFAAEKNGRVVGYIFALLIIDEGHIGNIAVAPEERGKGIGSGLLDHMLNYMETMGIKRVFLEVRKSNTVAKTLYKKRGFRKIGVRKKYYKNGEDAIVMMLDMDDEGKSSI